MEGQDGHSSNNIPANDVWICFLAAVVKTAGTLGVTTSVAIARHFIWPEDCQCAGEIPHISLDDPQWNAERLIIIFIIALLGFWVELRREIRRKAIPRERIRVSEKLLDQLSAEGCVLYTLRRVWKELPQRAKDEASSSGIFRPAG